MPSRADVAGRVGLTVAALPFFAVGAMFILAPERSRSYVHLDVTSPIARTDIRAVYGGGNIGAGVFLVLCAVRRWTFPGLFAALCLFSGLAAARTLGFILDEAPRSINALLLAGETAGTAVAFALIQYNRGLTAMKILKTGMRYLLALFFIVAGINHFVNPDFYIAIMPAYLPWHRELVLLSGATEIVAGALLLFPRTAWIGAWGVVAMLIVFLTVHVDMIVRSDEFSKVPRWALYLRLALQVPLIAWAWWFTRRESAPAERPGT